MRAAPLRAPPPGRRGGGPAFSGPRSHARSAHAQAATAAADPMASERLPSRPACLLVASAAAEGEARAAGVPWARRGAPGAGGRPPGAVQPHFERLVWGTAGGRPWSAGLGRWARLSVRGDGNLGWRLQAPRQRVPLGAWRRWAFLRPVPRAAAARDRRGQRVVRASGCSEEAGGPWQAWGSDSRGLGSTQEEAG